MDSLQKARNELSYERDGYRKARGVLADKIRAELPQAAAMADEISDSVRRVLSGEDLAAAKERNLRLQRELSELLAANGYERDALFDVPMCPKCGDTGYIKSRPCACLSRHIAYPDLGGAGGSFETFDAALFSDAKSGGKSLSQRENMEGNRIFCERWADGFPDVPDLFLNGGTGQGKTFLCSCVLKRVARRGYAARYAPATEFGDMFAFRNIRGEYVDADLLVIDDLGTEMTTAFVQSSLYDVINTRMTRDKRTIVNSNLLSDELKERYMPQISSRLLGAYKSLFFYGEDLRRARKTKQFSL
ncbi:DNA replication protein DnaC [Clostridia bacterium]|nr:DNA replication protein DnaC [Clostridia bacterium]